MIEDVPFKSCPSTDVYTILKESDHEEAHAEPEDIPEQVLVTKMADKLKDKLVTLGAMV